MSKNESFWGRGSVVEYTREDGSTGVLLSPAAKKEKYFQELKDNKLYDNEGREKYSGKRLSAEERSYRVGYRKAMQESADLYYKHNDTKEYDKRISDRKKAREDRKAEREVNKKK